MKSQLLNPELWLERYGDILFRYALVRVRDREIAADLVQETLLAALKSQSSFKGQASEATWLVGILKHKLIDYVRKSSREIVCDLDDELVVNDDEFFDRNGSWQVGLSTWSNPEKALEQEKFKKVLEKCINKLPTQMAQAFLLREADGLGSEEICEVTGISTLNNYWVLLSRARLQLRRCLDLHWFGKKEP